MIEVINDEFHMIELARSIFQVQKEDPATSRNISGGKWYRWGDKYRRVPHDWAFRNKMSYCLAMHWCFQVDKNIEVCPTVYLTSTNLHNC